MYDVYYIYRSVTHGQNGRAVLDRAGIPARLIRSPRELAPAGCAYALTLRSRDAARAERLLQAEGAQPRDSFRRTPEGGYVRRTP